MNLVKRNKVFIKYLFSAGSSFFLDLLLFSIFLLVLNNCLSYLSIIASTILARVLSSIYNFFINSRYVFRKYNRKMILKYYILAFVQMIISALLVYLINKYLIDIFATLIKFVVDIVLFIVNYFIQKNYIFV